MAACPSPGTGPLSRLNRPAQKQGITHQRSTRHPPPVGPRAARCVPVVGRCARDRITRYGRCPLLEAMARVAVDHDVGLMKLPKDADTLTSPVVVRASARTNSGKWSRPRRRRSRGRPSRRSVILRDRPETWLYLAGNGKGPHSRRQPASGRISMAEHMTYRRRNRAGGGTLARHLAPSGRRLLCSIAATGFPASRELVHRGRVRGRPLRLGGQLVRPGPQVVHQPQVHYFVGGATKRYGAALYRMRAEDFGELRHHDGLSPPGPSPTRTWSLYYTAAETMYQVHGARARIDGPAGERAYPYPRSPTDRGSSSSPMTWLTLATTVPRAVRHLGQRGQHAVQHLRACADSTASRARCTPRPTPRSSASAPPSSRQRHPGPDARVVKLESDPAGTAVTQVVAERDGETEGTRAISWRLLRSGQLRQAAAGLRQRQAPERVGDGSDQVAATSCTTTARPSSPCPRTRTRPCSRRPWASMTSTSGGGTSTTRWATSR